MTMITAVRSSLFTSSSVRGATTLNLWGRCHNQSIHLPFSGSSGSSRIDTKTTSSSSKRNNHLTVNNSRPAFDKLQQWFSSSSSSSPSSSQTDPQQHENTQPQRWFSSSSSSSQTDPQQHENTQPPLPKLEDAHPERIKGIQVNPESVGYHILPGNLVYKTYKWSGNVRKLPVDLVHGYFWMINDLRKTNSKPTLANTTPIPVAEAQLFPTLSNVQPIVSNQTPSDSLPDHVNIPWYFESSNTTSRRQQKKKKRKITEKNNNNNRHNQHISQNNQAIIPTGGATLVTIAFRDSGYKMLESWTKPFNDYIASQYYDYEGMESSSSSSLMVRSYKLTINDRWIFYPFRKSLTKAMLMNDNKNNDTAATTSLVYYSIPPSLFGGSSSRNGTGNQHQQQHQQELEDFCDTLRLHNVMTGYVFLLDQDCRIRFAASGVATTDELNLLFNSTRQVLEEQQDHNPPQDHHNPKNHRLYKQKKPHRTKPY